MRTPLLAGNWKLHCLTAEARKLAQAVAEGCKDLSGREVMVAPPYTALAAVAELLEGSKVQLGGQNLHWESSGAYTGEVSAAMLRDVGCRYVVIGHSERRQYFAESDYTVAKKVGAAAAAGLTPIMCVGETLEQREEGVTMEVISHQVAGGLCELPVDHFDCVVIAYEPIWAIGTGKTATSEQAQEVHAGIRELIKTVMTPQGSQAARILYGGSVKPTNIDTLMACPDIDGALVGGASLKADDFLRIVHYQESRP